MSAVKADTHMKYPLFVSALALLLLTAPVPADTMKIPEDEPAASVDVPKSWKPEATDKGIATESPDKVATVFFEVTSEKGTDKLIDVNIDWLVKEQEVRIDPATKKEADFENAGRQWKRISWDADSKEWGPASVGFMFTQSRRGQGSDDYLLDHEERREKHDAVLSKMLDSVKSIE